MNKLIILFLVTLQVQALTIGKKVPNFTLMGHDGKKHQLQDVIGKKTVVLEWFNHGCPFVRKHYDSKNMQLTQNNTKTILGKDNVVWYTIISSAEGKQGFLKTAALAKSKMNDERAKSDAFLLDMTGEVGKMYGAKTTPHLFIINKKGLLAYQGAMDSIPSADPEAVLDADNFIIKAAADMKAGKKVSMASTKAYGCSVKYKS